MVAGGAQPLPPPQQRLQFTQILQDLPLQVLNLPDDNLRRLVLHLLVFYLLIAGDREVVVVLPDLLDRHIEALRLPVGRVCLPSLLELLDDIGDIAPAVDERPLVIERVAVRLHVIEPDLLGLPALRED